MKSRFNQFKRVVYKINFYFVYHRLVYHILSVKNLIFPAMAPFQIRGYFGYPQFLLGKQVNIVGFSVPYLQGERRPANKKKIFESRFPLQFAKQG